MSEWQYYRIRTNVMDKNPELSVIDILSDAFECNQEDIEWIREGK